MIVFRIPQYHLLCIYRLIYNSEDDTFYDNIHTKVLVPSMGDSDPKMVESLDGESKDFNLRFAKYFYKMVKSLVNKHGYERKFSIRAAPYDWRLAGGELLCMVDSV